MKPQAKGKHKPAAKKDAAVKVNQPRVRKVDAPAAVGFDYQTFFRETSVKRKMKGGGFRDAICVEGREWIGSVQVPDEEIPGAVYDEFYMSPAEFAGTRLSLYSRLYEKFLFEESDFEYIPGQGSDKAGSLIIAYDRDISDPTPPATDQGVRQFLAMEDAVAGNVWTPHRAKCPLRAPEDGFFCNPVVGGDDRLAYQGQLYIACMLPSGLTAGASLGSILLHYKCLFFIPQLENELSTVESEGTGAGVVTSAAPGTFMDVLGAVATSAITKGVQQYLPKLQADGTWAITLPEGLYDYMTSLSGGTNTVVGAGSAVTRLFEPTLEALEPQPAPAPQPMVEIVEMTGKPVVANSQDLFMPEVSTSDAELIPTVLSRAYLSVPRGGARVRQAMLGILNSGTGVTWASPKSGLTLTKLGASVQSLLNFVPAPSPIQEAAARKIGLPKLSRKTLVRTLMVMCAKPGVSGSTGGNASVEADSAREQAARLLATFQPKLEQSVLPPRAKGPVGGMVACIHCGYLDPVRPGVCIRHGSDTAGSTMPPAGFKLVGSP